MFRNRPELAAGCGRHRDDHFVDVSLLNEGRQACRGTEDGKAVNPFSKLRPLVIQKAHWLHAEVRVAFNLSDDHGARVARAHHEHPFRRTATV